MSQSIKVTESGKVEFTASQITAICRQQSLIRMAERQLGDSTTARMYANDKAIADRIERLLEECSPNGEKPAKNTDVAEPPK